MADKRISNAVAYNKKAMIRLTTCRVIKIKHGADTIIRWLNNKVYCRALKSISINAMK
jgi:hypothetical protein